MKDLIERLEKLDAPCRECDAEIHLTLNPDDKITIHRYEDSNEIAFIEVTYPDGQSGLDEITGFTRSIDAALTLIPDGWEWSSGNVYRSMGDYEGQNHAVRELSQGAIYSATHKRAAIAICIAALRARQSLIDGEI